MEYETTIDELNRKKDEREHVRLIDFIFKTIIIHACAQLVYEKNHLFDWSIFTLKSERHAHMYTHMQDFCVCLNCMTLF